MNDLTTNFIYQHQWLGKVTGFLLLFSTSLVNAIPVAGVEFPQSKILFIEAVVFYDTAAAGAVPGAVISKFGNAQCIPENIVPQYSDCCVCLRK